MPSFTTNYALRKTSTSDPADGPTAIGQLADDVDTVLKAQLGLLPQGYIANAVRTSTSAGVTSIETVVDSVTFTAVAGRRYKVTWQGVVQDTASSDTIEFHLRYAAGASVTSAGTLIGGAILISPLVNFAWPATCTRSVTGIAAGQTTVGAFIVRTFGTGTLTAIAAANYPTELLIEDIT